MTPDALPEVPLGSVLAFVGTILGAASVVISALGRFALNTKETAMKESYDGLRAQYDKAMLEIARVKEQAAERDREAANRERDALERIHRLEESVAVSGRGELETQRTLTELRKAMVTRELFASEMRAQTNEVIQKFHTAARSVSESAMAAAKQPAHTSLQREEPSEPPPPDPPRPRLPSVRR